MREQLIRQLRALPLPRQEPGESIPLESEAFRLLFPCGISRGTLTEWLSEGEGSGTETLTMKLASNLRGTLLIVDSGHNFYPPAAAALGLALSETIVLRPRRETDSLWAIEQSLRCRGVGAVLARLNHLESREFRRLQLAAERGGTVGVFLRPARLRASPSWAQARFLVRPLPSQPPNSQPLGRRLQIESLHFDGRDVVELELNDATGSLRLVTRMAHPAITRRAAGA